MQFYYLTFYQSRTQKTKRPFVAVITITGNTVGLAVTKACPVSAAVWLI